MSQWHFVLALEFLFLFVPSQPWTEKRKCAFQVKTQNIKYRTAGNVSGSVQVCEHTHCCVGYFQIVDGQPEVDVLACDLVEKSCPNLTCKPQTSFQNKVTKCVCNSDLCNGNITWTPESPEPPEPSEPPEPQPDPAVIVVITLIILCTVIVAVTWRFFFPQDNKGNPQALPLHVASPLCSCQTTNTSEIDITRIELQQALAHGRFASVWRGKYRGSLVAVKVIPTSLRYIFNTERDVYELPLMKHAGIIHFLGTGTSVGKGLVVLQFAEYGSLHSFLSKHTNSWMSSLKLSQSLSEGLSYLHSDLHMHDVHKPPVAHRDLSSSNVLVKADGTCALSDFGCSTILRTCSENPQWQSQAENAHTQEGTLRYMSPEVLEGSVNLQSGWCLQGDVYALGLLLWEIWMRCSDVFEGEMVPQSVLPYESELGASLTRESLTWYVSYMGKRPSIPKHWDLQPQGSVLQDLLRECWDCDPDARLTAQCVEARLHSLHSSS